jgi:hypothetical protein
MISKKGLGQRRHQMAHEETVARIVLGRIRAMWRWHRANRSGAHNYNPPHCDDLHCLNDRFRSASRDSVIR